jgi:hypothetical protein
MLRGDQLPGAIKKRIFVPESLITAEAYGDLINRCEELAGLAGF